MNDLDNPQSDQVDQELIEKRQREIWLTVVIMLVSFCIGTSALLALLWFVFKVLIPQMNF